MKTLIFYAAKCPTCCQPPCSPARTWDYDTGKTNHQCVDHFHTGHLVAPSEKASFHGRPDAKRIRAAMKLRRMGGVTEFRRDQV